MGLTTKTINSSLLGKKMNIAVCVPDAYENIPLPVLYFLHGRTGNETLLQWFEMDKRASSLIESGIIKPLIIVCPNMDNSRGINSSEHYQEVIGKYGLVHKGRYEDYLLKEVIPFIDSIFYTIKDRSARYIGGVSSGGYTALSIGLRRQDLFSKIGGHMPAIDLSFEEEDECYFADEAMWLKNDPITIAQQSEYDDLEVFLDDGREDEGQFYRACEKLYRILQKKGANVQNHRFTGHHNREYIMSYMETYLRFYGCG
ncbi:MAG: prolyl oligopeptidase family serine peptidase [Clostridiales bacterium]|jgi:enterochelin esterase-like enzyme|nr:prolyl oligopeptidase family serine peptidase [Clostridiales bacterium]